MSLEKEIRKYEKYFIDPIVGDGILAPPIKSVACKNIKYALRSLGYTLSSFDNIYDDQLVEAVKKFQIDNKHSSRDGYVGPRTRKLIIEVILREEIGTNIWGVMSNIPILEVSPTKGPLGTHFVVRGTDFVPNEDVVMWYITPSGMEARFPPTYYPDSQGSFDFVPYSSSTPALMEIGSWEIFGEGNVSGKTNRVTFQVEPALKLTRPLRVFLCHSASDKQKVRVLYHQLKSESVDPWLDEEKLLPGQDWAAEITKAVRSSDVVLACLSNDSITKEGYVHKELKLALDVADEKPEGTIFLIPVRLEECDIPTRLQRLQWVNIFEYRGFERLIYALRARAESLELT